MGISQFVVSPLKSFCILVICFLARKASGIDPQYLACVPKSCGDGQNITFPFYIENQQEPFCGYPGFKVSCSNKGNPVLKLSGDTDYIIQEIFYDDQSVIVSDAAVWETNKDACIFPRIENVSLVGEFQLYPNQSELVLLYNCNSSSLPDKFSHYKVGGNCSSENDESGTVLAMWEDESDLGLASENCNESAVAPVNVNADDKSGIIEEMLRRGFALKWIASDCSVCGESGGKCGFDNSTYHFQCYCPDRPHAKHCTPEERNLKLKLGLGLGGGIGLVVLITFLFWIMHYRKKQRYTSANIHSGKNSSGPSSNPDLETGAVYFGVPIFSYRDLAEATNDFNHEKELGDGGFGAVYYGKLRDGREVAVKRLYEHNYRRVEQFMNEVKILTLLRHKNLVSLYGCTSRHSQGLLLVYEFVPNGTVADHLHGERTKPGLLTWPIRMNIAIETANALAYLHASDIIHRDVKTNNILLDSNFCVKVADFGLSRLFPNDVTHVSTAPQGTPGYVDPEYYQCYQLTDKSDVYSFGVVLVELISSMPAVDMTRHRHEINLSNFAMNKIHKCAFDELIDPCLGYQSDEEVKRMTTSVAELAFLCLQQDKEIRPSMDEVLEELKRIKSGESKFEKNKEKQDDDDDEEMVSTLPPPSPPFRDEDSLLKNIRLPPSPISVTQHWESSVTTPNTSG